MIKGTNTLAYYMHQRGLSPDSVRQDLETIATECDQVASILGYNLHTDVQGLVASPREQ